MTQSVSQTIPQPQQKAPSFSCDALVNNEFKTLSLSDYSNRFLVIFFYPLDFTFVCPSEIIEFSDRISDFNAINCDVIGVSVDSKYAHLAWSQQPRKTGGIGEMKIPLIADLNKQMSRDYGVLNEADGCAFRGTFIIDQKQTVRVSMVNDFPIGRSVDEILRLVDAVQFNDKFGEVCPVGWKKGMKGMKDTPEESKEYFMRTYK